MNEFIPCCYNADPRAAGQRAERGPKGPKTLSEGESASESRHPDEWALDWQVARRRDSVGWHYHSAIQMGGLGNDRGLSHTETRFTRSRSSAFNNQFANLPSTTYRNVC